MYTREDMQRMSSDEFLTGDFQAYAHILDCLYRCCENRDEELFTMVIKDALESDIVSKNNLVKQKTNDVLKFFRGLLSNNTLMVNKNSATNFKRFRSKFIDYVNFNQENWTGRQWLNILEMTRYAGKDAFDSQVV